MREFYSIDDLSLDVAARRVERDGRPLEISGHALDILIELVRRAPDVVSTESLMDRVWPDVVVGEENVKQQVLQLRRSLDDDAKQPRYVATVRGHGYQLVPSIETTMPHEDQTATQPRGRQPLWAALAVTTLLILSFGWLWKRESAVEEGKVTTSGHPLLLVETFSDRTNVADLASLKLLFTDGLARRLASLEGLEVIPETALGASLSGDSRSDSGREALIITGQYYLHGENLIVEASLTQAVDGVIVGAIEPVAVPNESPLEALRQLAERIQPMVAGSSDPFVVGIGFRAPADIEAYREYALGLEAHVRLDFEAALPHFERSESLDGTFAAPRITRVLALTNLDRRAEAREALGDLLAGEFRLLSIERRIAAVLDATLRSDHTRALTEARRLADLSPQSPWAAEAGRLALLGGHVDEAIERLRPFVEQPGPLQDYLPWHYYLALALHANGEHDDEAEIAAGAFERFGVSWGTTMVGLRAHAGRADSLAVERLLAEAEAVPGVGATRRLALTWSAATEMAAHGEMRAAQRIAQTGLAVSGNGRGSALESFHLARLAYLSGGPHQAASLLEHARAELAGWPEVLGWSYVTALANGEFLPDDWRQQLYALTDTEDPAGEADFWIAAIEAQQGQMDAARGSLAKAVAGGFPRWSAPRYRSTSPELHAHPLLRDLWPDGHRTPAP